MRFPRALLVVGLASLVVAAPAGAVRATGTAPPGNSGVDQYRESAPPAAPNGRRLSQKQRSSLADQGRDGRVLAEVLDRTGGVPGAAASTGAASSGDGKGGASGKSTRRGTTGGGRQAGSAADADVAAGDASRVAPTSSGSVTRSAATSAVGPFPVWSLLVAALVLVGVGLVLRRRGPA